MRVTVKEWAAQNRVTERAVRARLVRGTLPGSKERDPSTRAELWYVDVPEGTERAEHLPGTVPEHTGTNDPGTVELVRLVRDLNQQLIEVSGRCGWLQAQLEESQNQVRLLSAPAADSPDSSLGRVWWQFWRT